MIITPPTAGFFMRQGCVTEQEVDFRVQEGVSSNRLQDILDYAQSEKSDFMVVDLRAGLSVMLPVLLRFVLGFFSVEPGAYSFRSFFQSPWESFLADIVLYAFPFFAFGGLSVWALWAKNGGVNVLSKVIAVVGLATNALLVISYFLGSYRLHAVYLW